MNRTVFSSSVPSKWTFVPPTNTQNASGAPAYQLPDQETLAQIAITGTFHSTYYAKAEDQKQELLAAGFRLLGGGQGDFVARSAVYARKHGHMKDAPALLAALVLATPRYPVTEWQRAKAWEAIDNVWMLSNLCQVVRSGILGRRSFGTRLKKEIQFWINTHAMSFLFNGSIGTTPSLADVIKMTHPRAGNEIRNEFYGYLVGKENPKKSLLPSNVLEYERFKASCGTVQVSSVARAARELRAAGTSYRAIATHLRDQGFTEKVLDATQVKRLIEPQLSTWTRKGELHEIEDRVPDVPPDMLTSLPLKPWHWKQIALNAGWNWQRKNLQTLARHGAFKDKDFVSDLALQLQNPERIRKSRVMPYQIMQAYLNATEAPDAILEALGFALEVATENVPKLPGEVALCLDVSGSMHSALTGDRGSGTTQATCIQVAALMAASLCRTNPGTWLLPFNDQGLSMKHFSVKDPVLAMAQKLGSLPSGGTNCSAPLKVINHYKKPVDTIIFVSDYESWVDAGSSYEATATMKEWKQIKVRCPKAKMVCINLTPSSTVQAPSSKDILNVGGFSDSVFTTLHDFVTDGVSLVERINQT